MREQLSDANPASAWHWGDYALDPARRQLTREGEPVEIEDRVFDLLVLLLQRRERPLDRQEISAAIWGKRPVSDATLRQLVYAARRAVGDDGDSQHTISTLYGRGLQWVARVEMVFEIDADPAHADMPLPPPVSSVVPVPAPTAQPTPPNRRRRRGWLVLAALACAGVGVAGWLGMRAWHHPSAPSAAMPTPRVAIEPFVNATGDASLDWVGNGLPGLLGGLLNQAGGVDVVDSKQVLRASHFKSTQGRSREQQLRFATGANVIVSARLTKLADKLYELAVHVEPAQGDAADFRVDGERPGALATLAVSHIRHIVGLDGRPVFRGKLPRDPFLAEAFARGVDLAVHGKYADAQSYFAICVKGAPEYLPARLRLGDAQINANNLKEGGKTLNDLLVLAEAQKDARMAARALFDLGLLEANRGQAELALQHQLRAAEFARRVGDTEYEIGAHLVAAAAAIKLNKPDVSARELEEGRRLLVQHPNYRRAQGMMYDVEGIIAFSKGNHAAMMSALRAGLALNQALGDERSTTSSMNNLATGLDYAGSPLDSLAVALPAYVRAKQGQYRELEFQAGETVNDDLWKIGMEKQALVMSDALMKLARQEDSEPWQVTVLHHVASAQLVQGNAAAALASVHEADAVMGPKDMSADLYFDARMLEARAAFLAEPAALPRIRSQLDTYVANHEGATAFQDVMRTALRRQKLVHALAYAAAGQAAKASSSVREAASAQFRDGLDDSELREVAFTVANANGDKVVADIALSGLDVTTSQNGWVLALYAKWMRQSGNTAAAGQAEARLVQLQKQGTVALASAGVAVQQLLAAPSPSAEPAGNGG